MNAVAGAAAVARVRPAAAARTRLLQVVLSLSPGGTEHLVVEMCRRLPPEFEVSVCCLDEEGAWAAELRRAGVEVTALRRGPGIRPVLGWRIAQLAAQRNIDLLHCHQYSPFVYGRLAMLRNRRLQMVYTEHGRLSDAPPSWKRRLANPVLSRFDGAIVAVSDELRRYMFDARFPLGGVSVIHNGIDPQRLPTADDRVCARRRLELGDGDIVAMTVARLDPVKDLITLLDAFAIVRRCVPAARLVVVGDGPERARLAERSARPDLAGAVRVVGFRSDVRQLLAAADLYVCSSISEGISITILEAMAAGLPIVATRVGGTPEILSAGCGVLVPGRNSHELAAAVGALAVDERRRAALGAAARRRLESAFTIDRMVDDYSRLYRRVLS